MEFDKRRKKKKRMPTGELEIIEVEEKKFNKGEDEEEREDAAAAGGSSSGDHAAAAVPTEEEVEEFYAILRRMKVAVDYFDQKGKGGKEWREVLEQVDFTLDDDGEDRCEPDGDGFKKNPGQEAVVTKGFDLNAAAPLAADAYTWLSEEGGRNGRKRKV